MSPAARLGAQDVLGRKHRMFAFFSIPALRLIVNEKFPCWLFFFFFFFFKEKKYLCISWRKVVAGSSALLLIEYSSL